MLSLQGVCQNHGVVGEYGQHNLPMKAVIWTMLPEDVPGDGASLHLSSETQQWHLLISTRFPSSALVPTLLGEGSPTKIDYRKKVPLF